MHASAQPPLISTRVPVHARAPTHTRAHKHARKHARERTAHAHTLPCSHASARDKRTPTHARSPERTPVRSCVWSCTRTHVPARAFQQRIHTCTYARTRARTHTGEHACSVRRALQTWARPIRVVRNARAAGAHGRRCAAATAQQQHASTASHTHTPTLTHVTAAATHARAQPHSATRTHTHTHASTGASTSARVASWLHRQALVCTRTRSHRQVSSTLPTRCGALPTASPVA